MPDFRETVADRLERAADRMYNSGFLAEERRYRDAAASIRAGLSFEETQALERQMLTAPQPSPLHRLSALAAQGEYDAPGSEALEQALNEPMSTDIESGANQLLSTAFWSGLSDPFSPAQAGWIASSQSVDPYTGLATGEGNANAFTGGQNVNPYTGAASTDGNNNAFTGGQGIDPYTGNQNSESFTGGQTSSQSPSPGTDNTYGSGSSYSGQNMSILNNPELLTLSDAPANANIASDALPNYVATANGSQVGANTEFTPQISDIASDTGGSTYIGSFQENGVTYYQFADISGFVYEVRADTNAAPSTAPAGTPPTAGASAAAGPASPATPVDPQLTAAQEAQLNAAIQQAVGSSGPSPVDVGQPPKLSDVLAGTDWASPSSTQTQQTASPPPPPPSPTQTPQTASPPPVPPDPTQTQQTASPAPLPPGPTQTPQAAAPPPPQPGSPTVPFDPQAGNPFVKWLLYGNDTPILDFLTNDSNLQVAQDVALGVSAGAATIATGGLLLDAAPGVLGSVGSSGATSILGAGASSVPSLTAATVGTGAAGIVASDPNLLEEIEEGAEGALPALESEVGTLASEVEGSLPPESPSTEASALMQAREEAAELARKIVQQELDEGRNIPNPDARFGTWLDALAKSNVRQAVAEGRLPNTFVTSPTVSISRGYLASRADPSLNWIKAPDVWDTATGRAWDFMSANEAAFYEHEASYLGTTAYGSLDPGGTVISEINPLFHQGFDPLP